MPPTTPARVLILAISLGALYGCGSSLPARFVVERDVGELRYRRYQKVLDVEFPIEGNAAVGHTASYVQRGTGHEVHFATAFVTVYEKGASLAAEVRERLDTLGTYELSVGDLEGEYVWWLDGGSDRWALWVSDRYLVKLGAPRGEEIPEDLAETYTDLYPSDLDEHGRAREGTGSHGLSERQVEDRQSDRLDDPRFLEEGAPR
jgi:hypothetical protein